jgi:hypothetical protein
LSFCIDITNAATFSAHGRKRPSEVARSYSTAAASDSALVPRSAVLEWGSPTQTRSGRSQPAGTAAVSASIARREASA